MKLLFTLCFALLPFVVLAQDNWRPSVMSPEELEWQRKTYGEPPAEAYTAIVDGFKTTLSPTQQPGVYVPTQKANPAVVRVGCLEGNSWSIGSGTLVDTNDQHGLIVTNWHIFRDNPSGAILVRFPDKRAFWAKRVGEDRTSDLAALIIENPGVTPLRVIPYTPQRGENVAIAGWGERGTYKTQTGTVSDKYVSFDGKNFDCPQIYGAVARQGDSGGPILTPEDEVVGVLAGCDGRQTCGTGGYRLCSFLAQHSAYYRSCPGGNCPRPVIASQPPANYNYSYDHRRGPFVGQTQVRANGSTPTQPAPTYQPPPQPTATAPVAQPIKVTLTDADYEKLAGLITERIAKDGRFKGKDGLPGTPGENGMPGADAKITDEVLNQLAGKVQAKLAPITFYFEGARDNDGNPSIHRTEVVYLGGHLNIPAQRMEIAHPNGDNFYQEKPLGEPIALELVPRKPPK